MRRRMPPMRALRSPSVAHPFPSPKQSQAIQSGKLDHRAKYPKPAIALCGALSLKKKGENTGALKTRCADGVQKFTSCGWCRRRKSYQSQSVTATVPIMAEVL